jgi:hypothetical protein
LGAPTMPTSLGWPLNGGDARSGRQAGVGRDDDLSATTRATHGPDRDILD